MEKKMIKDKEKYSRFINRHFTPEEIDRGLKIRGLGKVKKIKGINAWANYYNA